MLTALYSLASFTGAFLVFLVQPMAAKVMLPVLGGTPAVWSGSMLFFQAALLLAYLYAHLGVRMLGIRLQALVHLLLVALVFSVFFPIDYSFAVGGSPTDRPIVWLFGMLLVSVGMPYFIVSSTAPLLQYWFSNTAHHRAGNPYFLYAASNVGSIGGLLCYPFLIEPAMTVEEQGEAYRYGFLFLGALLALAALRLYLEKRGDGGKKVWSRPIAVAAPGWGEKLWWVVLAFIPASLLYGVTTYITTDIASIPLFWVIPLVLYLLSFVLVFAHPPVGFGLAKKVQLPLMAIFFVVFALTMSTGASLWLFALHLLTFFVCAIVCHGLLVERKPLAGHLTEFYLWMAFGGVLGGVFNTLVAPHLFSGVAEYPLMLMLSLLIRSKPGYQWQRIRQHSRAIARNLAAFMVIGLILLGCYWLADHYIAPLPLSYATVGLLFLSLLLCLLMGIACKNSDDRFLPAAAALSAVLLLAPYIRQDINETGIIFQGRNFFGVSRVQVTEKYNAHIFLHGTTLHGIQGLDPEKRLSPTSYYAPLKELFTVLPEAIERKPMAIVGMGVGTVACYGATGQEVDLFEIDPLVVRIAKDEAFFTYLKDCPPQISIKMGDGRIALEASADKRYGVMVMDAFSSDAIPVHLLTREAVAMYLTKLDNGGVIAFNISNRHVDLRPVLASVADALQIEVRRKRFNTDSDKEQHALVFSSEWVVFTSNGQVLQWLDRMDWEVLEENDPSYLWTDDFSNLMRVLKF